MICESIIKRKIFEEHDPITFSFYFGDTLFLPLCKRFTRRDNLYKINKVNKEGYFDE